MSFKSDQRDVLDFHLSLPQELLAGSQEHFRVLPLNLNLKWKVLISYIGSRQWFFFIQFYKRSGLKAGRVLFFNPIFIQFGEKYLTAIIDFHKYFFYISCENVVFISVYIYLK